MLKGSTVYAAVEIDNVNNLDAGQFDMSFNPDVLKVASVSASASGYTGNPPAATDIACDTNRQ